MNGTFELQENLGIFCLYDDVEVPSLATEKSACFDLKAHLAKYLEITLDDLESRLPNGAAAVSYTHLTLPTKA